VSTDGSSWRTVWSTTTGDGDLDYAAFAPTSARYVRMVGQKRATGYGYSLWELWVYGR
jgi:hypothetical protein